jgi:polar amino acid transport system substrate-binding protein
MSVPVGSALDAVLARGRVRVAVEWHEPPSEGTTPQMYLDPDTGRPSGGLPDLGRQMAADLGVQLELVNLEWSEHLPALLEDRVDLLLSFGNTPARALQVDFARPLIPHEVIVLVGEHGPSSLHELRAREDARVVAARGSSVADVARLRFPEATVDEVDDPAAELEAGDADASVQDAITRIWLERHPSLRPLREEDGRILVVSREFGHPAIRQGDPRLLNWLENWLEYHRAQGTIERLCDAPLRATFAN